MSNSFEPGDRVRFRDSDVMDVQGTVTAVFETSKITAYQVAWDVGEDFIYCGSHIQQRLFAAVELEWE